MIRGTIDRFEEGFAVVEIFLKSEKEQLVFIHILAGNLPENASEGDVLKIESVASIPVNIDELGLSLDTLSVLKRLENTSSCKISIDSQATASAKSRVEALAAELFED